MTMVRHTILFWFTNFDSILLVIKDDEDTIYKTLL